MGAGAAASAYHRSQVAAVTPIGPVNYLGEVLYKNTGGQTFGSDYSPTAPDFNNSDGGLVDWKGLGEIAVAAASAWIGPLVGMYAAPVAGASSAAAVDASTGVVGANGAFLGEGIASGVAAWDAAAVNAGLALSTTAAAVPAAGNGAFLGENVASGVSSWDAAATNAGLSLTTPAAALPTVGGSIVDAAAGSGAWTPSVGQIVSGVGSAASLVSTVAGAANVIDGIVNGPRVSPAPTSQAQPAAGRSNLLLWIAVGAAAIYAIK